MISLDNYCKNAILIQYNLPKDSFRTFEEFVDLNNLTDISEEAINFFYNYNINDKVNRYIDTYNADIFEMLSSQNNDKIKSKLLANADKFKIISINDLSKNESSKKPLSIILDTSQNICDEKSLINNELLNNELSKELNHIIDFYGYYITLIEFIDNHYSIFIEAIYTDDIFNEVRSKGGYIYHVTEYSLKTIIEKTGLRPKVGKTIEQGGYRYFPERLYFVKHNKDKAKLKQTLIDIIKDKELSKYIIVKVKLNNHNISLYKDTAYDENNNIYTYCAISPKMIEIYDNINKI